MEHVWNMELFTQNGQFFDTVYAVYCWKSVVAYIKILAEHFVVNKGG